MGASYRSSTGNRARGEILNLKWEALGCADAPWAPGVVLRRVFEKPLEAEVGAAFHWRGCGWKDRGAVG